MLSDRNGRARLLAAFFAALALAAGARAQDAPAAAAPQETHVSEKGFRSRIFEVKHRDPASLYNVLQMLGSGFRGSGVSTNRELRTVAVRDFPENIAVIEEALRRLDTPEAARPDVEFRVYILVGSNGEASGAQLPAELAEVTRQLQTSLGHKNFNLMSSQVMRAKDGRTGLSNKGIAELKLTPPTAGSNYPLFYDYRFDSVGLEDMTAASPKIQLNNFHFNIRVPLVNTGATVNYENVGFTAPVSLRHGERVVAGTTSMQDKSVVVVLSANVVK